MRVKKTVHFSGNLLVDFVILVATFFDRNFRGSRPARGKSITEEEASL